MRFIRSRFGIVLWCAIALLIALVPLWRLRAVRQWQSPAVEMDFSLDDNTFQINNPSGRFGLTPAKRREAARRFPDEITAQLANLDVEKLVAEVKSIQGKFDPYYNTPQQAAQAAARLLKVRPRLWQLTDNYFARYDELERQHPNSNAVRAKHLRDIMRGEMGIDEGPLPADADDNSRAFYAGILRIDSWISPQQRDKAIATAREGARLEPDNAFFPWMEATLQFASKRPLEALRALEAAGKCSTFDDYVFASVAQRNALLKRLQATGWEDDYAEFALASSLHLVKMRRAGRAAVGRMRLARRDKNDALAFRWAAGTARASYVVASSDENALISALLGTALCATTLHGATEAEPDAPIYPRTSLTPPPPTYSEEQRKAQLEKFYTDNVAFFAAMARSKGDEQLALQTEKVAGNLDARELEEWSTQSPRSLTAPLQKLASAHWLNAQLLRLTLLSAALWCVLWTITRRWPNLASARKRMLLPAMFGVGVTGALLAGARAVSPQLKGLADLLRYQPKPPELWVPLAILRDSWPLLIALLWTTFIFGGAVWQSARTYGEQRESNPVDSTRARRIVGWCALIFCALAAPGAFMQTVPAALDFEWLIYVLLTFVALIPIALSVVGIQRTQGFKRVLVMCVAATFWVMVGLIVLSSVIETDATLYGQFALFSAIAFSASALALVFQAKDFAAELAARTRIAAGALALLSAVAYFGITLWSVPVEARARAMMARQLQIGEVAWLREQMKGARNS